MDIQQVVKAYKLDIAFNKTCVQSRKKMNCWRSRLETDQNETLRVQLLGALAEYLSKPGKGYELNIRLIGKCQSKNGK